MKTKKQAQLIIDNSMAAFGLSKNMETDPKAIKNIIDSMKFDDFNTTFAPMDDFLKEIITKPRTLQPMFEDIETGIITKHPAILDFLALAIQKEWLHESEHIQRAVHTTFVLEAVTAAMSNNHQFFVEVQEHYRNKQRIHGLDTMHILKTFLRSFFISHDLFNIAKAFSLDPLMVYLRVQRGLINACITKNDLNELYKNGEINYIERKLLSTACKDGSKHINKLVGINIYEAGIKDYADGFKTNAMVAHELSEDIKRHPPVATFKNKNILPENSSNVFYDSITETQNLFPNVTYTQEWASLYTTWNMAFVLGNINNLDIIFPKLLIPSIINAESDNFLGTRVISLWLSINHALFRSYEKDSKDTVGPNNKEEMATAWAEINKKYASGLGEIETCEKLKILEKDYNCFFSSPYRNFFRLVKDLFST
ncbi:hypothetical protein MNBD_GAMMA26-1771 [hydrothermal vent metagenome]|uniref:Uncharacterized protein n=1 Tax=hydrothermal vent metagenome TaxID=652676 RepID=A0A3B1BHQ1_9ZZZZ